MPADVGTEETYNLDMVGIRAKCLLTQVCLKIIA